MFAKIWASSLLVLALCLQVTAHASVSPPLGVPGAATRADVRRPTAANPCGAGVNIVSEFNTSTAATVDASGSVQLNATSYNAGTDGSLLFKAQVDATGTGKHFVPMDISTNGPNSPPKTESLPITIQLPSGIRCTGGSSGNQCLAQFISGAGFGNCVVISQSAAAGIGDPTSSTAAGDSAPSITTTGGNPTTAAGRNSATATAASCKANTAPAAGSARAAFVVPGSGTLMARSLLADLRNRGEGAVEIAKRDTPS